MVFLCPWNGEGRRGLYSNGGENMNRVTFNEGWQRIQENHEPRPYFSI